MEDSGRLSLGQVRAFLDGSGEVCFQGQDRQEVYRWVNRTLRQQDYSVLKRSDKGLVRRYLAKMTGLSRAQVARLIGCYQKGGEVKARVYRRRRFPQRYTGADIVLLAQVDEAHETMSGPATQKILQRAWHEFHDRRYERLWRLSVAQLYRLRKSRAYCQRRVAYQATRPTQVGIGERRKPDPQGRPGFLRVDTVHQGDRDGTKGLYHINAVDQVTQWQVVGATAQISEAWLLPVLEAILSQFPFRILGFHSDNGSEFINQNVANLLNKLLAEQTKSRPHHSNDNGLAETKNGWVIRKHMGYGHWNISLSLCLMKTPFVISPSPTLLYLTPSFKKALHMITNTLDNRQGISCIIGDIGMGKSSLLRFLHAEYLSRDESVAAIGLEWATRP